jgi:hypothetical protein
VTNPAVGTADPLAAPGGRTRLGPVRFFRLRALGTATLLALAGIVARLLFLTVLSLYPGTDVVAGPGPRKMPVQQRPAVGEVGECRRVGPVSGNGLGYWWECRVRVRTGDGREVQTVLRNSIVFPHDAGRPVELREACLGKGNTNCGYGRPVDRAWGLAAMVWAMLTSWAMLFFMLPIGVYLLAALVGPRRYEAVATWLLRNERPPPRH